MSPNLLAFNMFASEMRLVLRDSTLLSRAEMQMGIEKVIGNRWKAMTREEKEKHIDKARVEQARLIAEGGMPQAPSSGGRAKKQKATGSGSDPAPKRRRGRPPKTSSGDHTSLRKPSNAKDSAPMMHNGFHNAFMDHVDHTDEHSHHERDPYAWGNDHHNLSDLFMPFNPSSMPVVVNSHFDAPKSHMHHHHHASAHDPMHFLQHDVVNVMDQDGLKPTNPPGSADLTGMKVEGLIDGTFDTGYFMTVRVNGQTLRGMLYREDACMRQIGQHVANAAQHERVSPL